MVSGCHCQVQVWDSTQRTVVIPYRRFGATYGPILKGQVVRLGQIGFPKTSVRNYHSTLRGVSEERICERWTWCKCAADVRIPDGRVTKWKMLNWWNIRKPSFRRTWIEDPYRRHLFRFLFPWPWLKRESRMSVCLSVALISKETRGLGAAVEFWSVRMKSGTIKL